MSDRLPLSVLLLARDEAERLERLLPTLSFASEIVVVVDAATTDSTREVASRLGARVFERPLDGFGPQRRFALERCTQPWVLWLDADERLDAAAVAAITRAVKSPEAAGYRLRRRGWFLSRPIRFCGWGGETVLRLFRRERARFNDAPVHEQVMLEGRTLLLEGRIEHLSYESWEDCRDKLVRYAAAGAESARRAGRTAGVLDVVLRPPLRFARMYLLQAGFLDGSAGLVLCALAAAQVFLKYAELWARRAEGPRGPRP